MASAILTEILAHKEQEVARAKQLKPLDALKQELSLAPPVRSFKTALSTGAGARIIAECKKKSPSRGLMHQRYDPVALAKDYARGGAAAISVLTDERYFGGCLEDLRRVRAAVDIPLLRKDFVIDPYQLYEARAAGADAFLLIAGPLDTAAINSLLAVGRELGMDALVESHSADELALATASKAALIGINNRNLNDFSVNLEAARQLYAAAQGGQAGRIVVCESGIKSAADIENMARVGYKAFLVGEALVTNPDPAAFLNSLVAACP